MSIFNGRLRMSEAKRKIALPWYTRDEYPDIRNMMIDSHNLASSYEQWLAAAENNENVGRQSGLEIERIRIEPSTFARWCAINNLEPDSTARMRYVAEVQAQTAKS